MSDQPLPDRFLVACRHLRDYEMCGHAVPATFARTECQICGQRIVVSPQGIAQSLKGGWLVCNPCALEMARRLEAAGRDVEFMENPSAAAQIERLLRRRQA